MFSYCYRKSGHPRRSSYCIQSLSRNAQRYKTRFHKMFNQKWWMNYSGLKFGDVHNPYKTRYPF